MQISRASVLRLFHPAFRDGCGQCLRNRIHSRCQEQHDYKQIYAHSNFTEWQCMHSCQSNVFRQTIGKHIRDIQNALHSQIHLIATHDTEEENQTGRTRNQHIGNDFFQFSASGDPCYKHSCKRSEYKPVNQIEYCPELRITCCSHWVCSQCHTNEIRSYQSQRIDNAVPNKAGRTYDENKQKQRNTRVNIRIRNLFHAFRCA